MPQKPRISLIVTKKTVFRRFDTRLFQWKWYKCCFRDIWSSLGLEYRIRSNPSNLSLIGCKLTKKCAKSIILNIKVIVIKFKCHGMPPKDFLSMIGCERYWQLWSDFEHKRCTVAVLEIKTSLMFMKKFKFFLPSTVQSSKTVQILWIKLVAAKPKKLNLYKYAGLYKINYHFLSNWFQGKS